MRRERPEPGGKVPATCGAVAAGRERGPGPATVICFFKYSVFKLRKKKFEGCFEELRLEESRFTIFPSLPKYSLDLLPLKYDLGTI